jgi:hypothetical protein
MGVSGELALHERSPAVVEKLIGGGGRFLAKDDKGDGYLAQACFGGSATAASKTSGCHPGLSGK